MNITYNIVAMPVMSPNQFVKKFQSSSLPDIIMSHILLIKWYPDNEDTKEYIDNL